MKLDLGRVLVVIALMLIAVSGVAARNDECADLKERELRQAIGQVLEKEFLPGKESRVVPLAAAVPGVGCDAVPVVRSWLPPIPGVVWDLRSEDGFDGADFYYFDSPRRLDTGEIYLPLLYGNSCSAHGRSWRFRIVAGVVKGLKLNASGGRGCGQ